MGLVVRWAASRAHGHAVNLCTSFCASVGGCERCGLAAVYRWGVWLRELQANGIAQFKKACEWMLEKVVDSETESAVV